MISGESDADGLTPLTTPRRGSQGLSGHILTLDEELNLAHNLSVALLASELVCFDLA